jgi:hypothetical protein
MTDTDPEATEVFCRRPQDVADMRRHLIDFHTRRGPLVTSLCNGVIPDEDDGAEHMNVWLSTSLKTATLYWVAPDMCRLLDSVAPSIPPVHPEPPEERALVVFATPLAKAGGTEHGSAADTAAMYWNSTGDNVGVVLFEDREGVFRVLEKEMPERSVLARQEVGACRLLFGAAQTWPWRRLRWPRS